ncbi:C2H2-like zinc finger protein [Striga hermonthica]|uniref:C2H2-like zinc finger protein n=1 Tax=Striga hermonthica TaxID=68872 RepID=A0A9N7MPK3_STRHE|nr:C2H2-like zinc finger protein [Striga hermonthica]
MAEEGYYYESRFVCKLCNKKFPCGKSLGGHMRSHVVANSAESDELFDKKIQSFADFDHQSSSKDSRIAEFVNGQQSSYVLRENPKKTWRAADTTRVPLPQDKICKQCGKGFQSMKALCGHMACHSERDKNSKDDSSWTSENQKAVLDSCSDTEEGEERRIRTRSSSKSSKRYKKFVEKSSQFFALANNNYNNVNGSSSMSEIDGQDHEEVAMCLMLLSRDLGNNNNYSVVESSDNNSVVLETKSSSIEMRKMENEKKIANNDSDDKLKGKILDDENAQVEDDFNSDSGYFLDERAKSDSDPSVDWFKKSSKGNDLRKSSKDEYYYDDDRDVESRKRKYLASQQNPDETPHKKSKYECYNCKKSFKSYQALGGHRPCHKRTNAFNESRDESGENSPDESADYSKKKSSAAKKTKAGTKGKDHICPFCDRVFKNGQALGGHKRSHFIITGPVENENTSRGAAKADELRGLLDLNLPAPEDDGDN